MYPEPYHFRQQGAYQQDQSWLDGNFDFFTKIMGFSFFASLFGGLGGGDGDRSGNMGGGGRGSYVWNTISLFLLGLLVETGRRLCQWIIQRVKFR
jgi:chaperone BCS1